MSKCKHKKIRGQLIRVIILNLTLFPTTRKGGIHPLAVFTKYLKCKMCDFKFMFITVISKQVKGPSGLRFFGQTFSFRYFLHVCQVTGQTWKSHQHSTVVALLDLIPPHPNKLYFTSRQPSMQIFCMEPYLNPSRITY